jgi:hypothetical protein
LAEIVKDVEQRCHDGPSSLYLANVLVIPRSDTAEGRHLTWELPGRVQVRLDEVSGGPAQEHAVGVGGTGHVLMGALQRQDVGSAVRWLKKPRPERLSARTSARPVDQRPQRGPAVRRRWHDLEVAERG